VKRVHGADLNRRELAGLAALTNLAENGVFGTEGLFEVSGELLSFFGGVSFHAVEYRFYKSPVQRFDRNRGNPNWGEGSVNFYLFRIIRFYLKWPHVSDLAHFLDIGFSEKSVSATQS